MCDVCLAQITETIFVIRGVQLGVGEPVKQHIFVMNFINNLFASSYQLV